MDRWLRFCLIFILSAAVFSVSSMAAEPPSHSSQSPAAQGETLTDLQRVLVQEKNFKKAFEIGERLIETHAGEPSFDFFYGMAALESDHPQEATFAFERVLIARPENLRARLELGRAHLAMKDYNAARAEFEEVLKHDLPANVQQTVRKYLTLVEIERTEPETTTNWYVGLQGGFDSNINSATTDNVINVPGIGQVLLGPASLSISDEFVELRAGGGFSKPFNRTRAFYSRGAVKLRENINDNLFDTNIFDILAGYAFQWGKYNWRFPAQFQLLQLAGRSYRYITSFALEISRPVGDDHSIGGFAQGALFRYPNIEALNNNQAIVGANWIFAPRESNYQFLLRPYYGTENEAANGKDFNARNFYGAQFLFFWTGMEDHTPFLNFTTQRSDFNGRNPLLLVTQKDELYYLILGWNYNATDRWIIKAYFSYLDNLSNSDLSAYDRKQLVLGFEYNVA